MTSTVEHSATPRGRRRIVRTGSATTKRSAAPRNGARPRNRNGSRRGGDRGIASPRGDGLGEGRDRRRGDEQRERPEESVARPEESEEDFRRGLY